MFLISSPPVKYPCYYGIDTSTSKELVANTKSIAEIEKHIQADSLHYLSIDGTLSALNRVNDISKNNEGFCLSCFKKNNKLTIYNYY